MIILIFGSSGQLGSEFLLLNRNPKLKFLTPNSKDLDITNKIKLDKFFKDNHPDVVLNLSGYTDVDEAEDDYNKANKINHLGVQFIKDLCNQYKSLLIHISTDYVFGGALSGPFSDCDQTSPINKYGYSKDYGEKEIIKNADKALIIRIASLYGRYKKNFLKSFINILISDKKINVVSDQLISLTYSYDIASFIMSIIEDYTNTDINNKFYNGCNIIHAANKGYTNWYDVAKIIAYELNYAFKDMDQLEVKKIKSNQWVSKALRPKDSRLVLSNDLNFNSLYQMPHWEDSLKHACKLYIGDMKSE